MLDLSSPKLEKEDCLIEIPEVTYDKNKLLEIYEQVKDYARVKYLPWRETPDAYIKNDESKGLVIQHTDNEIRNPAQHGGGVNLLDFSYIRELTERFNFHRKIVSADLQMIVYKDDFIFRPHVDGFAASVVMFPIISPSPACIDFYHQPNMVFESYKEYANMGYDKIVHSHYYNDTHATIFNSHVVHGVKPTDGYYVKLKINMNEDFSSVRRKYRMGQLIK